MIYFKRVRNGQSFGYGNLFRRNDKRKSQKKLGIVERALLSTLSTNVTRKVSTAPAMLHRKNFNHLRAPLNNVKSPAFCRRYAEIVWEQRERRMLNVGSGQQPTLIPLSCQPRRFTRRTHVYLEPILYKTTTRLEILYPITVTSRSKIITSTYIYRATSCEKNINTINNYIN